MAKRRSHGLGSAPAAHEAHAAVHLEDAEKQIALAWSAKTCSKRAMHAINASQAAARFGAEMRGAGKHPDLKVSLDIGRQARDVIELCVRPSSRRRK